jgi:tetratricopeptide (TPR) repeat protein
VPPGALTLLLALPAFYLTLALLLRFRTADVSLHYLLLLLMALALRHNRFVADLALLAAPCVAAGLSRALLPYRRAPAAAALLLLAATATVLAWPGKEIDLGGSPRERGMGLGRHLPVCAVDFLQASGVHGRAFVSYTSEGLLLYRLWPAVTVNMDARNEVYDEQRMDEYFAALGEPGAMRAYLERHPVDFFLVAVRDLGPGVLAALRGLGFAPVFLDGRRVVLLPRDGPHRDLVAREELRLVRPEDQGDAASFAALQPPDLERALAEAARLEARCPGAAFGPLLTARLLLLLGRPQEALAAADRALAVDPDAGHAHVQRCLALALLHRREEAVPACRRALRADPGNEVARTVLHDLGG